MSYDAAWKTYLEGMVQSQEITQEHLVGVIHVWEDLNLRLGSPVRVPFTGLTEKGAVQLAWSKTNDHYADIEVHPNGMVEWFYRDRDTTKYDGSEDAVPRSEIPDTLIQYLKF